MKKITLVLFSIFTAVAISGLTQTATQVEALKEMSDREASIYLIKKSHAVEWAKEHGYPVKAEINGSFIEIQYIDEHGIPQYFKTDNVVSAATISTNKVQPGGETGLNLTGSGITVREWDAGSILSTHQEFGTRVTNVDAVSTNYHSTHVAGTIMAAGVVAAAKGMSVQAGLRSFDWNSDVSEMASEGASGALISNHSYGYIRGWYNNTWYGDPSISTQEDYLFGFYDSSTQQYDQVAVNAPYFLICKAAGNDRGDSGDGTYPPDGPYDCIGEVGVAKNILTVAAVDDIPGGYSGPSSVAQSNCYFSSWGPADDGRVKPDIATNGYGLYSTYNTNNTSYASLSGTSMATPSAAGSLALLQQHHYNLKGSYMRAATLKALVIHTADEAGSYNGPDYMFGWGLMNTKNAALRITADQTTDVISELTLSNGATYNRNVIALGSEPLKVTIVWTDPAGTPPSASLDPITPMLVNDLDLRLTNSGSIYYPWKLDRNNPSYAATNTGENNVDNVEVVFIASPVAGATYTITVDHDGTLSGGSQAYSMIISGIQTIPPPVADFSASNTNPLINIQVNFTDLSTNSPDSWSWSFSPATVTYVNGTSASSQNPQVQFNAPGSYSVTLTATNSSGSDPETKTNYINAINCTYYSLPYSENFAGTTIPTCWSQVDNQGNAQVWQFGTITGYSPLPALTGNYAYLNSAAYGSGNSQNADLITPTFDLSSYSAVNLLFNHYFRAKTGSSGKLYYSTNNGSSWTLITTFTTTTANPAAFSQAISAVAGQSQVKFKWNYTGTYGYYWAIDDIQLTGNCSSTSAVSVTIAGSANNICAGTPVTYTATPVNGGIFPSFQWKVNGTNVGINTPYYTYQPANSDVVTCVVNSSAGCVTGNPATSNAVTMIVNPLLPVSVSITASANPVCAGSTVTITATPVNGGTPTYQWYKNSMAVATGPAYSSVPSNGDQIWVVMTSSLTCKSGSPATSNVITMSMTPAQPVSIVISRSNNPICQGTSVYYTALPTNGGTNPSYQWKVNGVNIGTNSAYMTYMPANNDNVTCLLTSNISCSSGNPATSNALVMTVNPVLPVSVGIAASQNQVCSGTSVNFTATPVNGGPTPHYQWKVNGTNAESGGSPTFEYEPANNDAVTCILSSSVTCPSGNPATSNSLAMTVNPSLPVSVTIAASQNPIPSGTPVTFNASPVNGGTSPSYQWRVNGSNVGTNSPAYSYTPVNNDVVTCILTSNVSCPAGNPATSNAVTMIVNSTSYPTYLCELRNDSICDPKVYEFDVYLLNTGSGAFELASIQVGINISSAVRNGGTISVSPVPGSSELLPGQQPTSNKFSFDATKNCIRMVAMANPGVGNGSIISTTSPGTRVVRIRLTNTVNFGNYQPNHSWCFSIASCGYPTKVNAYYNGLATDITVQASHTTSNLTNPILNKTVTTFNVTGSGSYCQGSPGINVCTDGSEAGILYTLMKNGNTTGLSLPGNGSSLCFGNQNAGNYTVSGRRKGTCITGSMNGSAEITEITPVVVSVSVTASDYQLCAGTSVTYTADPVNGGTPIYQWYLNGGMVGTGMGTYTHVPANGDQVYVLMTSSLTGCVTGSPATSNTITMSVGNALNADFVADNLTPLRNQTVLLTDLTGVGATTWNWTFDRPGVVFVNGTTLSSQNPQVQFTDGGLYTLTLSAGNGFCIDSEIKTAYIRAGLNGLWAGTSSIDWYTMTNWDNWLIPDANTDIIIPASAAFWPVFSGDLVIGVHCKNLVLIDGNSKMTITGNLTVP
jgi:PKD repeat protein